MSATMVVDLLNATQFQTSIGLAADVGNVPASGEIVGTIVDLLHADGGYTNVFAVGGATSGPLQLQVQVSDSTASGSFVDCTSGLVAGQFPTSFVSGGTFWVNSGLQASGIYGVYNSVVNNAPAFCSGGAQWAAFQRTARYARVRALSGNAFNTTLVAGFCAQRISTQSGGGFSYNPTSGQINV